MRLTPTVRLSAAIVLFVAGGWLALPPHVNTVVHIGDELNATRVELDSTWSDLVLYPGDTGVNGGAWADPSENKIRIYTGMPRVMVWAACNHEMAHIDGKTHEEMTVFEYHGANLRIECLELLDKAG